MSGYNLKDIDSIKQKAVPCPALCELYYNFGQSNNCVIRNKTNYLVISPGSDAIRGNFEYQGVGQLDIKWIHLYSPSVNKYDNSRKAAEIIITTSGADGTTITLCIPVESKSNSLSSGSISWFNSWVSNVPNKGNVSNFDINGFSLNKLIPQSGYFIKEGSMPMIGNPKAKNLFFINPLSIRHSQVTRLRQVLNDKYSGGTIEIKADQNVSYNKLGTTGGPGKLKKGPSQTIKCTPIIDGQGGNIPGDGVVMGAGAAGDAANTTQEGVTKTKGWWESLDVGYKILIIAALPVIILIYVLHKYVRPAFIAYMKNRKKKKEGEQAGGKKSRRRSRKSRSNKR